MGCSACMASCPVKCIVMKLDQEGFLYPVSDDTCIHCGVCERVCPIAKPEKTANKSIQKAYAVLSKNKKIWRRSASGGAFSEICLAWGDENTIIVGAAWDGLRVHHKCVVGVDNIGVLCKSKYISSDPENVFNEIKQFLESKRRVIFSGTPCQVAGLKSFLKNTYSNLLTIDLICHGVGSPAVFSASMQTINKQLGVKIKNYEFRAKRRYFEADYIQQISTDKGSFYLCKDPYIDLFLSQRALRPSCGDNCVFRDRHRQGDITIADFKGLRSVFPTLSYRKYNYSTLVTNSAMGEYVMSLMRERIEVYETELDNIEKYNPLFSHHTWSCKDRGEFFDDFIKAPQKAIDKWAAPATIYKPSLKRKIKCFLPESILKVLYCLRKR